MDALPMEEKTGLPYASKIITKNFDGNDVGTMHSCGHDMHMTVWTGTARALVERKDEWSGTIIMIGQPAEEIGAGAAMMLKLDSTKSIQFQITVLHFMLHLQFLQEKLVLVKDI